jgi:hypothetical protein
VSNLKLKEGTIVEFDEDTLTYHFPQIVNCKHKKISSRAFPSILGENKFESIGKTILSLCRMEQYEPINPYYTIRGDIGERLVYDYLKANYDVELMIWNKKDVNYDNFPKNLRFGALIDIAITAPKEYRAVVEVKSKSLKDKQKIEEEGGLIEEVMQGKFIGHLSKVDNAIMVYIFLTPEQEEALKNIVENMENPNDYNQNDIIRELGWTFSDMEIVVMNFEINHDYIEDKMNVAWENLKRAVKSGNISKVLFSNQDTQYLDNLVLNGGVKKPQSTKVDDDDLPF